MEYMTNVIYPAPRTQNMVVLSVQGTSEKRKGVMKERVALISVSVLFLVTLIGLIVIVVLYIIGTGSTPTTSSTSSTDAASVTVPSGMAYVESANVAYIVAFQMDWDTADTYCKSLHADAHLVQPTTDPEFIFWRDQIFPGGLTSPVQVWTSGRRQDGQPGQEWTWTNNQQVVDVTQNLIPITSSIYDGDAAEPCIYMHYEAGFPAGNGNLKFGDTSCSTLDYITVCELRF